MPVIASMERHDSDLARQLRRAISSAALNVAEGTDQRGKRRGAHCPIALGSARESLSCLEVADAFGYNALPSAMLSRFNHVIGTLYVLTHR